MTAAGNPLVRRLFGKRIKPGENYGFWYTHAYGFAEPGRDLVAADVTPGCAGSCTACSGGCSPGSAIAC